MDKWQKMTDMEVNKGTPKRICDQCTVVLMIMSTDTLDMLSDYCRYIESNASTC